MNNEFEKMWKDMVIACYSYYLDICVKDRKKQTGKNTYEILISVLLQNSSCNFWRSVYENKEPS